MNIIVCIDGLREGGVRSASNAFKLYNMLEDRTETQIAFYDSGVPNVSLVVGRGMAAKIRRAYEFLFERFEVNDQIFLFGSGRGAAAVSLLAEMLDLFGVLPMGHKELIPEAYSIFNISDHAERAEQAHKFVSHHHTMWCRIPFLGTWDPVVSRGGIASKVMSPGRAFRFYTTRLPSSVSNCYQALAIDEERSVFHPRLWDSKTRESQRLMQVWFAGVHGDVCGGYAEQGLSDITLEWMTNHAVRHGLRLYKRHHVAVQPDPYAPIHDSRVGSMRLWRRGVRATRNPTVHASVLLRGSKIDYAPFVLQHEYDVEDS